MDGKWEKSGRENSDDYEPVAKKGEGNKKRAESLRDTNILHIFWSYPVDF